MLLMSYRQHGNSDCDGTQNNTTTHASLMEWNDLMALCVHYKPLDGSHHISYQKFTVRPLLREPRP